MSDELGMSHLESFGLDATPDTVAIDRYWRNEASSEERAQIEAHFAQIPQAERARFEALRGALAPRAFPGYSATEKARHVASIMDAVSSVASRIAPVTQGTISQSATPRGTTRSPASWVMPGIAWAAVSGVAFSVLLLMAGWWSGSQQTSRALAEHRSVYTTKAGERANITLPDGSTVVLNAASRLEVPATYAVDNRAVRLSGEAFFTVTSNTKVPFTVSAGASLTRVLGTSFVVRHYESDSVVLVAVRDGRVAVKSTVVDARQQITVDENSISAVHAYNPGLFTFIEGVLTLDEQYLGNAITDLNRWYDADIRIGDPSLSNRLLGGRFQNGSLSELAELLEWTFDLRVEREGKRLTLYPKSR